MCEWPIGGGGGPLEFSQSGSQYIDDCDSRDLVHRSDIDLLSTVHDTPQFATRRVDYNTLSATSGTWNCRLPAYQLFATCLAIPRAA